MLIKTMTQGVDSGDGPTKCKLAEAHHYHQTVFSRNDQPMNTKRQVVIKHSSVNHRIFVSNMLLSTFSVKWSNAARFYLNLEEIAWSPEATIH